MKCTSDSHEEDGIRFIDCCAAYCRTCPPLIVGQCKGCKLGYDDGERKIAKAKCRIKARPVHQLLLGKAHRDE